MPPLIRKCACGCGEDVDYTHSRNKKYASEACRNRATSRKHRALKTARKRAGRYSQNTPAMQQFQELAGVDEDFFRETLHDVVRDLVTEAVHDNVLGAAEVVTGMLPMALAALYKDLQSPDEYIAAKARDAVLKYGFEFKKRDDGKDELGTINVLHQVALPDTPLGHNVVAEVKAIEETAEMREVEAFEQDWPACANCGERKHPDALYKVNSDGRLHCSSCRLATERKRAPRRQ